MTNSIAFGTSSPLPGASRTPAPRVAVIGAGIAGLSAAQAIVERAPAACVTVFEAAARAGGIVQTVAREGYLVERSADSFIMDPPHALELCRKIGLGNELLAPSPAGRRALLVRDGKLVPVPEGFVIMAPRRLVPLLRSPLLSWRGKLRLLEEPLIPPRSPFLEDESVAAFARRRFGQEVYARMIQPLVGGIYTGDPEQLSMAATMPRFWRAEEEHGSVLRSELRRRDDTRTSGARYAMFLTPRGGMAALTDAIAASLPSGALRLSHRVVALEQSKGSWQVFFTTGTDSSVETFDAVILATPANVAAALISGEIPQLAEELGGIASAGATIVCLGYRREQVARPPDAFGFVVPNLERRQILAGSFLSNKFAFRAPSGCILMRIFLGGALQPGLVDLPEDRLLDTVQRELGELIGVSGPPNMVEIARWHGAMPQYHVGHQQRVTKIERLVESRPGFALAGNAYHGVGIAQCVKGGQEAAALVLRSLRVDRPSR